MQHQSENSADIPEGRSQRRGVGKRHRCFCPFSGSYQLFSWQHFKPQQYRQGVPRFPKDCRELSIDYSNDQVNCYFWRSRGGAEVDFILYGQHHFHALEVKNSKQIHPKSLRSLKTFQLDYPEASVILLYRGTEKLMVDGILCCPVDDFLLQLKPNHWLNGVNNVKIRT